MYQTSMAKCVTESVSEMRTENQEAFSELFSRNSSIPMASSSVDLQCLVSFQKLQRALIS